MNLNELYKELIKIETELDNKSNKLTKRIKTQFKAFERVSVYHDPDLLVVTTSALNGVFKQETTLIKVEKGELNYQYITEELANKVKALYDDAYFKEVE